MVRRWLAHKVWAYQIILQLRDKDLSSLPFQYIPNWSHTAAERSQNHWHLLANPNPHIWTWLLSSPFQTRRNSWPARPQSVENNRTGINKGSEKGHGKINKQKNIPSVENRMSRPPTYHTSTHSYLDSFTADLPREKKKSSDWIYTNTKWLAWTSTRNMWEHLGPSIEHRNIGSPLQLAMAGLVQ